jgi:cell fate (sporulation/competence/biofilm development) regulator YlbF (YheA/YmcA/DUF963 family)
MEPYARNLEGSSPPAFAIASTPAEVETQKTYQQQIKKYVDLNYTYIPMPRNGIYYDTDREMICEISPEQHIIENLDLYKVLELLEEHPFLLINRSGLDRYIVDNGCVTGRISHLTGDWSDIMNSWVDSDDDNIGDFSEPPADSPKDIPDNKKYPTFELEKEFPNLLNKLKNFEYKKRYGIITLADVNRRPVKERLYPIFAELANQISKKIEKEFADPDELLDSLSADTIGYWYQDKQKELGLHIAEYMSLIEMKQIFKQSSEEFRDKCGFKSNNQVERQLGGIEKSRNKVMHANRTLVQDQEDISTLIDRTNRAQDIIDRLAEKVEKDSGS